MSMKRRTGLAPQQPADLNFRPNVTVRWPVTVTTHYNDGGRRDVVRRVELLPGERLELRRTTLSIEGPALADYALDRADFSTILFGGAFHAPFHTFVEAGYFEQDEEYPEGQVDG
jgi:hypothetical protein